MAGFKYTLQVLNIPLSKPKLAIARKFTAEGGAKCDERSVVLWVRTLPSGDLLRETTLRHLTRKVDSPQGNPPFLPSKSAGCCTNPPYHPPQTALITNRLHRRLNATFPS